MREFVRFVSEGGEAKRTVLSGRTSCINISGTSGKRRIAVSDRNEFPDPTGNRSQPAATTTTFKSFPSKISNLRLVCLMVILVPVTNYFVGSM